MTALRPAPTRIDPLGPGGSGIYEDSRVVVERLDLGSAIDAVARADGRVHVRHCLDPMAVDDGIAEPLAGVLAAVSGDHATFCSAFTGIVVTSHVDPVCAWERFYRNSLRSIDDVTRSGYVEVYRHAVGLLGDARLYDHVLDLGCGFGFLALHLSRLGMRVTAADVDAGVVRLLGRMSDRLAVPLEVLRTDGRGLPGVPPRSVDAVTLLHVLEHVNHPTGVALLAEATRLARHRVVIAVPYEAQPNPLFGHIRCMTPELLEELGAGSGWRYRVEDHCGGWLVLDRPHDPPDKEGSS